MKQPGQEPLAAPQTNAPLPDLSIIPGTDFTQYGDVWVGYKPGTSTPAHTPAPQATFALEQRGGKPVFKWTAWADGYGSGTSENFRTMIIPKYPKLSNGFRDPTWCEREGDEAWYGTSFELPENVALPYMWAFPSFESQSYHVTHPNYGSSAYRPLDVDNFGLIFKTGHIPNPGSSSYNPIGPNGYNKTEYLLGAKGVRPLVKGRRIDLLTHVIYKARTNGVWQIDYRVEPETAWTKLYSNQAGDNALVQRDAGHPTLVYNDRYGSPGQTAESEGQHLEMQAYGDANPPAWTSHYSFYTWGLWRRQSRAACEAEFAGDVAPPEPPPDGDLDARVAALETIAADHEQRLSVIETDMITLG